MWEKELSILLVARNGCIYHTDVTEKSAQQLRSNEKYYDCLLCLLFRREVTPVFGSAYYDPAWEAKFPVVPSVAPLTQSQRKLPENINEDLLRHISTQKFPNVVFKVGDKNSEKLGAVESSVPKETLPSPKKAVSSHSKHSMKVANVVNVSNLEDGFFPDHLKKRITKNIPCQVEDVLCMSDWEAGSIFIEFSSRDLANKAVKFLHMYKYEDSFLEASLAHPTDRDDSKTIKVSHLEEDYTPDHLKNKIAKNISCQVEDVVVMSKWEEGSIYIEFSTRDLAEKAVKFLHLYNYDDSYLEASMTITTKTNVSKTVKVSHLDEDYTPDHLKKRIVKNIACLLEDITCVSKWEAGSVFIEFSCIDLAKKAQNFLHMHKYDDSYLEATLFIESKTIKVCHLEKDFTPDHFKKKIIKNTPCQEEDIIFMSKWEEGSIFIEFSTVDIAKKAAKFLHLYKYEDSFLEASFTSGGEHTVASPSSANATIQSLLKTPNNNQKTVTRNPRADNPFLSPVKKQIKLTGAWTPLVVDLFLDLLIEKKKGLPLTSWMDCDWMEISEKVGLPPQVCKSKKTKLYKTHAALIKAGRPTKWRHMKKVHLMKYSSLQKGPPLPLILDGSEDDDDDDDIENTTTELGNKEDASSAGKKWGIPDRDLLIDIWADVKGQMSEKPFVRKSVFWEEVSLAMQSAGRYFNSTECMNEMNILLDTFKRIFDNENSTGRGAAKYWRYYDKLYMHLGKSATLKPPVVVAAGTSLEVRRRENFNDF